MNRSTILGPLPANGVNGTVYIVPETGGRYSLWLWQAGAFVQKANIDVGETRGVIIREEPYTSPVTAYVEKGDWQCIGCDGTKTYWKIEVDVS